MFEGMMMGIGGTVGAAILIAMVALIARQWKSPRRIDRLERLVPSIARALLVLLHVHRIEDTNGDVAAAENELTKIITDGSVSQKAGK